MGNWKSKAKRKPPYKTTNSNQSSQKSSPLSLEQLSKQAMNDSSPNVPQMDSFKITEVVIRKRLSLWLKPQQSCWPRQTTATGSKRACWCPDPNGKRTDKKFLERGNIANVAPILKKGEKYKASNYCPVSLTHVLYKCIWNTCIVASQVMQHFTENNILYNH